MGNKSIPRILAEALWRLLTLPVTMPVLLLLAMMGEFDACERFVNKVWFITDEKQGEPR